jgi:hypothetical protein
MEVAREVLLHAEKKTLLGLRLLRAVGCNFQVTGWLGSRAEVAFLFVLFEDHQFTNSCDQVS